MFIKCSSELNVDDNYRMINLDQIISITSNETSNMPNKYKIFFHYGNDEKGKLNLVWTYRDKHLRDNDLNLIKTRLN